MKIRMRLMTLAAVLVLLSPGADRAEKTTPATMRRVHDPVQAPGELLKTLAGSKLDLLRVFSFKQGAMKQMLYDFNERLPDGTYILDLGEAKNANLANGILDPQDLLIFRIMDTGDRAPKELWPTQDGLEIELEDPLDHGKSYCYLVRYKSNPPALLKEETTQLLHWDPWEKPDWPFIVKSDYYLMEGRVNKIKGKYYKTAINRLFSTPVGAGGSGVNILDAQKMRAYLEALGGKIRVDANETDMIGGIDALHHGRIRGYGRQWLTVALPMGLEAPRIYSDVFTYDRVILSPMILHIPFNPESIITRAGIEFGYDLNTAAYGMRFYSPNCLDGVTIDGKMSAKEKAISKAWVPWFLITGPQGSMIFRVEIEKSLITQTKNNLTYIDDLGQKFPPENLPGSIGYARTTMEITSVKAGTYGFSIEWYFPPRFYKPGGYDKQMLQDFLNIKDAPLIIRVEGKTAKNQALSPPPLQPKKK